jgi:hypothetical protein
MIMGNENESELNEKIHKYWASDPNNILYEGYDNNYNNDCNHNHNSD